VLLVLAQTGVAAWFLQRTFPYPSLTGVEVATLALFPLFGLGLVKTYFTLKPFAGIQSLLQPSEPTMANTAPLKTSTADIGSPSPRTAR